MKISLLVITLAVLGNSFSWGAASCPGLFIGTTLGAHNVVNNGVLDPLWDSSKNARKVVRRDSEFFYITSHTHNLTPASVSLKQHSNDYLTTLYNLKDERPNEHTLTIMYSCKLTPVLRDTAIKLTIQPVGCPAIQLDYVKTCGAEFRPHPGVVINMFPNNNRAQMKTIVRDGIVLFSQGSKSRPVDKLLRNFEVDSDLITLDLNVQITPELEKIFNLEAGKNPRLMAKLREKAMNHEFHMPVVSYDESIIQILKTSSFGPYLSPLNKSHPLVLNLKLRCMAKEDAYINVVFPMPGRQSISIILTRHCKEALAPLHEMSKQAQYKAPPPQGRVNISHPPLSPHPVVTPQKAAPTPTPKPEVADRTKHHYFFTFLICVGLFYYLFKFDANQTKLRRKREKDEKNNTIFDGDELRTVRGSVGGINVADYGSTNLN